MQSDAARFTPPVRQPPPGEDDERWKWSAWNMVEAYAEKRRYYIAKGSGRPDMHRAANEIVRHTVEGKVRQLRH